MDISSDMLDQFERNIGIIGADGMTKLSSAGVIIAGIGGVGGFACEAMARAGIGRFLLIDSDVVEITNLNRQIIATHETIGREKTEVMKERMLSINPAVKVETLNMYIDGSNIADIPFDDYDYLVDAIDSVASKVALIEQGVIHGIPVISSMGAAKKTEPTLFRVDDISKTTVCPLARAVRRGLRQKGISKGVKAVYSTEQPVESRGLGSLSFVPSVCGLIIGGEVIKDIAGIK